MLVTKVREGPGTLESSNQAAGILEAGNQGEGTLEPGDKGRSKNFGSH